MPDPVFKVVGPKGGAIINRVTSKVLASKLGSLIKRFRKVTVSPGEEPQKKPPKPTPVAHVPPSKRELLHAYMAATAGNRYGWLYREIRPLKIPPLLAKGVVADCSFGIKILCHWAGIPDPTGRGYDGYGNSTSMFGHLQHISLAEAKVGDIVLFGPNGSWHAAMIFTPGDDPMLWSHGHQGAPNMYRLSADKRKPQTICRVQAP